MKKQFVFWSAIFIIAILTTGCVRKFTVIPQMKDYDFTVVEKYGIISYVPITDAREDFDKKGKVESTCTGGTTGITHLGDKNYENKLLPEFDKHLKTALANSQLFSKIMGGASPEASYTFSSSLEKFHVLLDEVKAQQTQACIGGFIGAAIASTVDVSATTDVRLTGRLMRGEEEVWRHTVTKQVITRADYGVTRKNAEDSMGEAIGESCKELITAMALHLSSK